MFSIGCRLLAGDYQTGLNIARNDYSHIESSILFKANLLRLQALIMEQLYCIQKNDLSQLIMAVEMTKTALQHYSKDNPGFESSIHGMAVSYFQLAHLQLLIASKTERNF